MEYEEPNHADKEIIEAISRNDPEELLRVVLSAGLNSSNFGWAQELCLNLSVHPDERVRGNSILSLGHLARCFGALDDDKAKPVINRGLLDDSKFVRGQAEAAMDDTVQFLHWNY
jgi:hypothetical protein